MQVVITNTHKTHDNENGNKNKNKKIYNTIIKAVVAAATAALADHTFIYTQKYSFKEGVTISLDYPSLQHRCRQQPQRCNKASASN